MNTWQSKIDMDKALDCIYCNELGMTAQYWDFDEDGNMITGGIQPCEICQKHLWESVPKKLSKTYSKEELYG